MLLPGERAEHISLQEILIRAYRSSLHSRVSDLAPPLQLRVLDLAHVSRTVFLTALLVNTAHTVYRTVGP